MDGDSRAERWMAWAGLATAGLGLSILAAAAWPHTVDDAYVAPRYGRHLAAGLGLSFNVGERAGSFSNPGWVLLAAAAWAVGLDPIPVLKGLGFASAVACLPAAHRLARSAGAGEVPALLAPSLLAVSGPFVAWAPAGLETAAAALAVTSAADQALRGAGGRAGLGLGVAVWLRPEVPALVPAFVWALWRSGRSGWFWGVFLPICGAVVVGRRWATGIWLPTAAAWKFGPAGDEAALWPFLSWAAPVVAIVAGGTGAWRLSGGGLGSREWSVPWFLPALACLQALAVGGAALRIEETISTMGELDRFFVPLLPALAAWVAAAVSRWPALVRGLTAVLLLGWNCCRPGAGPVAAVRSSLARAERVAPAAEALGAWLARELPLSGSVAVGDVGLPAHRFSGRVVDLYGLHTASLAGLPPAERARRVLALRPDAIALVVRDGTGDAAASLPLVLEAHHRVERELLGGEAFARYYRLEARFRAPGNPWGWAVFVRRQAGGGPSIAPAGRANRQTRASRELQLS